MTPLFDLPPSPLVPITGNADGFPVHRIFCVGQNYAEHAREMGADPAKGKSPIYFTKSPSAYCRSGSGIAYPAGTQNCHFEMELVVAIGSPGARIDEADALRHVFGYACGLDLTRRDLQARAKEKGHPWDTAKDFENAAVLAAITPAENWGEAEERTIRLLQNGETRQQAKLSDMIWDIPAIIADLSRFYRLEAGDLIYTGTPAGVGPVAPGDALEGTIDGLEPVRLTIGKAD